MECDQALSRLDAYLDGEMGQPETANLRDHIESCPQCGPETAALEQLRRGIRQAAPVYQAPPALRSQIRAALRRERDGATVVARGPSWLAFAASILIAV